VEAERLLAKAVAEMRLKRAVYDSGVECLYDLTNFGYIWKAATVERLRAAGYQVTARGSGWWRQV